MAKPEYPITPAVRQLRANKIKFTPIQFKYKDKGGTSHGAQVLGVSEHTIIKTLIMETGDKKPMVILMHGDREVSVKQMARTLKTKTVTPCDPVRAEKLTGYQTGGISPLGTKSAMPAYVESTILSLDEIYINGGKRGFFVKIDPKDLKKGLNLNEINVAV